MEWVQNISQWAYDATVGKIFDGIRSALFGIFEMAMSIVNNGNMAFWQDPVVLSILATTRIVGFVVMVFSIPFLLSSIIQQLDNLDMRVVLFSVGKTFLFVQGGTMLGLLIFKNGLFFLNDINFNIDTSAITGSVSGSGYLFIFATIGSVIFAISSLGRCSAMLLHIMSVPLYVPYVMKGDKQKLGEWVATAFVITVTYVFQYVLFYMSMVAVAGENGIKAIILLIACISVKSVLQHFGVSSSGTGTHLGSVIYGASSAYQGIRLMKG